MADEALDLLSTSESRWRSLRASGREWRTPALLSDAFQAQLARRRAEGQRFALITNQTDAPMPDEIEEGWKIWLAESWKRAEFAAGRGSVEVVFHESTWWSNGPGISQTNSGGQDWGHGEGPGEFLIRTADYPPLLEIREVTVDSWLGRQTLVAKASIRRGLEPRRGRGLHGLVIGDADEILLSIDRERGVVLQTKSWFQGSLYRVLEMNDVGFDEEFPPTTFEIRPLHGPGWLTTT